MSWNRGSPVSRGLMLRVEGFLGGWRLSRPARSCDRTSATMRRVCSSDNPLASIGHGCEKNMSFLGCCGACVTLKVGLLSTSALSATGCERHAPAGHGKHVHTPHTTRDSHTKHGCISNLLIHPSPETSMRSSRISHTPGLRLVQRFRCTSHVQSVPSR